MSPRPTIALLVLSVWWLACAEQPTNDDTTNDQADFLFSSIKQWPIKVTVGSKSTPTTHASVTVRLVEKEASNNTEAGAKIAVIFQAVTDSQGICQGNIRLPAGHGTVEVIVHKPGFQGPYTDESVRQAHGPFAPAAWIQTTPVDLANLNITLASQGKQP